MEFGTLLTGSVGVSGFSVVFDSLNLSCHYPKLLFLSSKVEYLEWGNTSLASQNVFGSLKIEITKDKKELIMLWISQDLIIV